MVLGLSSRGQTGVVLMLLGSLAFIPAAAPTVGPLVPYLAAVGAVVLTAGTWFVGTDVDGRVV